MKRRYTTKQFYLLFSFLIFFSITIQAQKISYEYDMAGNRIARKVVYIDNPSHAKEHIEETVPIVDQLGERKITVYPNPTRGSLAVEITGGDQKDQMTLSLFSSQGVQLQNIKTTGVTTPVNMSAYPSGWYILRIQVGDKMTELKIIKQ